ncbi:carbon-phosphorus lyase complex subunit PhnI [Vibrio penaeicida]|uniref:Carbon-phosphorus lyase complex subunit PhnI n=1 Tax=Vibrio penaeicida TaxID=104609 RepID=A0AAV5NNP2_9VIBR|nr:carbon-phosphorus lyase complex subunit PhnI [Vibrio penaeicida]RTZ22710.1 carbon-phosphorus lyase complex subunit PhnI [Vibrio penaeicida]GLQ71989.1 carbon-phosphorus lyase complex subunit PhnI [Vibrio penaeicida]
MYVAVKGGEKAIKAAHQLQDQKRRGTGSEIHTSQIADQLSGAVDRVMTEGGIYDTELAALAFKQASGDMIEAIFLLRAYRTTLSRFATSEPLDTSAMEIERRISATFKDLPGGQVLGPTLDYTHRLLDFSLLAEGRDPTKPEQQGNTTRDTAVLEACPQVMTILENQGLATKEVDEGDTAEDITLHPPTYPATRSARLQQLMRSDEGFLLSMGYSTQRGYGRNHPFAAEIRTGNVTVSLCPEELGFEIEIGDIELTECQMINGFSGSKTIKPQFTRGYGVAFGAAERKAMSMALVDRALQAEELDEPVQGPAQDQEFVLSHGDNVEAAGFVSHLKLPHYVDFQSELELIRKLQKEHEQRHAHGEELDHEQLK